MIVLGSEEKVYLIDFADNPKLNLKIKRISKIPNSKLIEDITAPISLAKEEVLDYFEGKLKKFTTPIHIFGTQFQQSVCEELVKIPYGETRSYEEQAISIGKSLAYRAVANANSANQIAIIIPCHRVIRNNGSLGGYGGGVERKKWLIDFERNNMYGKI